MNLENILFMRATGKTMPGAALEEDLWAKKLSKDSGKEKTIDFSPVISVSDALAKPALELITKITAVQAGSGDPSPVNIREFIGFSGLSLFRAGKNLIDISTLATENITYSDGVLTGTAASFASAYARWVPFDFSKFHRASITISAEAKINTETPATTNGLIIRIVYTNGTNDSVAWRNDDTDYTKRSVTSNANKDIDYIRITYANAGSKTWNVRNLQIEVGQSATTYIPYETPTEYAISWLSEAGIIYGGILDIITGLLTITHEILTIDETSGAGVASVGGMWFVDNLIPRIDGEWQKVSLCNSFVRRNEAYGNTASFKNNTSIGDYAGCSQNGRYDRLFFRDERFTTTEELNEYLAENPVTILKEMDEPVTYQLSPSEVVLLAGTNTLWNTAGDTALKYMAKR